MAEDLSSKATDFVRKVLTVGVGTIFLSEEALRALAAEIKLPKELFTGLLESAGKTKREFMETLSKDFLQNAVSKVDPREWLEDFLQRHEVNLQIKVNFSPKKPPEND